MAEPATVGILGGSGLYELEGLSDVRREVVSTPFGDPSGPLVVGRVGETRLVFLPRHGLGHTLLPSEINYRANIHALKQLGVERLIAVSAVGSLQEGLAPGDLVLVDQFIDKTTRRASSFFGDGVVGHVGFAEPVCLHLVEALHETAVFGGFEIAPAGERNRAGARNRPRRIHRGGTYVCMEGPQFSTRAESFLHRTWGADVIGMTAATEAKLAREAELCFAVLALVTDYDCWHPEEEDVNVQAVIKVMHDNVANAKRIVRDLLPRLQGERTCRCPRAAENAVMTAREAIPAAAKERLRLLYGRYL